MSKCNPAGADPDTITVHVPIIFRRRGGRRTLMASDGSRLLAPIRGGIDDVLVKAIARAFRWRRLIETGDYATIQEIAAAEKINASYVGRILRLTLLAPDIVEAILDGRQGPEMALKALTSPLPVEWKTQRESFCCRQ